MDNEILESLDNISKNFDYLLNWLQTNKIEENKNNINNVDFINIELSSFSGYLKSIDDNIKSNNQKITAFLDNISNLETQVVLTDNPELNFFTNSINTLIGKLDELKNNIQSINANLNIGINTEQIETLKNELSNNILFNFDISNIDTTIKQINEKINLIKDIKLNISFGDTLNNLTLFTDELDKIKNLDINNLNLNIATNENLDELITKLNILKDYKNLTLDINIKSNIDIILQELEQLKNINFDDFKNISNEKIIDLKFNTKQLDETINIIDNEIEKIQNININLNISDTFKDTLNSIQIQFDNITQEFKNLNLETEANIKLNPESIKIIQDEFSTLHVNINPDLELLNKLKSEIETNEFNIKINPLLDNANITNIETKNDGELKIINETENKNFDILVKQMEDNNKILNQVLNTLVESNKNIYKQPITLTPERIETNNESIITVKSETEKQNVNNNSNIENLLIQLLNVNKNIAKKLTKSSFNNSLEI